MRITNNSRQGGMEISHYISKKKKKKSETNIIRKENKTII